MRCWSCGSDLAGGGRYFFTCPLCSQVGELKGIRGNLESLESWTSEAFEDISAELVNIASILEWRLEKLQWEIGKMSEVLKNIDKTLKTPSQTQANEWREIAEELKQRGILDESEKFFLKSLETNPLDYMTYIGLGKTYLQMGQPEKARTYWEKSLPHASRIEIGQSWPSGLRRNRPDTHAFKEEFDYKSYSYRLIGRLDFCDGNIQQAVSILRKSIELSPNYYEGHYDYAQYCALLDDKESCFSSLAILMVAEPTLLKLAEKERNFKKLKEEIKILLQLSSYLKKAQQETGLAAEFFSIGREKCLGSDALLQDLNPFSQFRKFRDSLSGLNKVMVEKYKLVREKTYQTPLSEILKNNLSTSDHLKTVRLLTLQATESADQLIDLVKKRWPDSVEMVLTRIALKDKDWKSSKKTIDLVKRKYPDFEKTVGIKK